MNITKLTATTASAAMVLASALTTTPAFAQNTVTDPNMPALQDDATITNPGATTDNTRDEVGFDWRWLLPLLAIPLLIPLFKNMKKEDRSEDYRSSPRVQTSYHDLKRDNRRNRDERDEDILD